MYTVTFDNGIGFGLNTETYKFVVCGLSAFTPVIFWVFQK